MNKYKAGQTDVGKRLDILVSEKLPSFSRASLKNLFTSGKIFLNKKQAKPGAKLKIGDIISVDDTDLNKQPDQIKLPIVFENDDVIVIDKPAGILTHSKGAINLEPSVASFIKPKITDKNLIGNRAGIVHRLDRLTSGIIITAKNENSLTYLQKQFSQRKVNKRYLAIVVGKMQQKEALIDLPIMRDPKHPKRFMAHPKGKVAQTEYKVIKEIIIKDAAYSLLEIKPLTGRTHQIRIHLAYIGHPVVGDIIYGKPQISGMLLHADKLSLSIKDLGLKTFESPMPQRFQDFINNV